MTTNAAKTISELQNLENELCQHRDHFVVPKTGAGSMTIRISAPARIKTTC